ncbi:hypothetical protein BIW11_11687, partial [Tropilaelaps mercedesae]
DCGHVFCQRCLVDLPTEGDDSFTLCTICRKAAATMEVPIQEKFIAQLQCSCPSCEVVVRVRELRDHFTRCVTDADAIPSLTVRTASNASNGITTSPGPHSRINGLLDCQDVYEAISSVTMPWRESQNVLENRLNAIEERVRSFGEPTFPSYHTLRLIYANDRFGLGRVYRTPIVYIAGLGFYFAADTQGKNLRLWVSSLEGDTQPWLLSSAWRVTVRLGEATQGSGSTVIVRGLHVGLSAKFLSFFKDYERHDAILTACVEKADL